MRKWLFLAGVGVVAIAVVAIAVANLDAYLNEHKGWFEAQAVAAVGRPVVFDQMGVGLWPGLAVELSGLRIPDDARYSDGNLLEVAEIRVQVDWLSALSGDLEVSGIAVQGPVLRLIQTREGLNLDTLRFGESNGTPTADTVEPIDREESESGSSKFAGIVALLGLSDGEIRYIDRRSDPPRELRFRQLDFEVENVGLLQPIRFQLRTSLLGEEGEQNVRLGGSFGPVSSAAPHQIPLDLRLEATFVSVERVAGVANLPALGVLANGAMSLVVSLRGTPEELALDAVLDLTDTGARYGDGFVKPEGVPARLVVSARIAAKAIDIPKAEIVLADAAIQLSGHLALDSGEYQLKIASQPIALAAREALLPLLAGLGLGGSAALDIAVSGSTRSVSSVATSSAASVGLPQFSGTVSLSGFEVRVPDAPAIGEFSGSFELRDGGVFLASTPLTVGEAESFVSLQVEDLYRPVLKLNLKARKGSFEGVDYDGLDLDVTYTHSTSLATIDQLEVAAYGGRLVARGRYDSSDPDAPVVAAEGRLTALQLERALNSRSAGGVLDGKLEAEFELRAVGLEWESLKSSLTGGGTLSLEDGVLHRVNLGNQLLGKLSLLPGLKLRQPESLAKSYPTVFGGGTTKFQSLRARLQVRDGSVFVDELRLVADQYEVTARGRVSLDADVDLRGSLLASMSFTNRLIGEFKPLRYLRAPEGLLQVPFRARGPIGAVRVEPDLRFLSEKIGPALVGKWLGKLARATGENVSKLRSDSPVGGGSSEGREDPHAPADPENSDDPVQPLKAAIGAVRDLLRGR